MHDINNPVKSGDLPAKLGDFNDLRDEVEIDVELVSTRQSIQKRRIGHGHLQIEHRRVCGIRVVFVESFRPVAVRLADSSESEPLATPAFCLLDVVEDDFRPHEW